MKLAYYNYCEISTTSVHIEYYVSLCVSPISGCITISFSKKFIPRQKDMSHESIFEIISAIWISFRGELTFCRISSSHVPVYCWRGPDESQKSAEPAPWESNLCSEQQQRHGKWYYPFIQKITTGVTGARGFREIKLKLRPLTATMNTGHRNGNENVQKRHVDAGTSWAQ